MKSVARIVRTEFWTSKEAMDMYSAEDMYFMLYLMTNPHTTQLGIYPINKKYMSIEFKHSIESINSLLDRFENKYKIIKYSNDTNEIAIKNYLENSIIKGGKPVEDCLIKEISNVKDKTLLEFVFQYLICRVELSESVINILPLLNINNDKENDNDNERIVKSEDLWSKGVKANTKKIKETPAYELNFERLWKLYPKKLGKPYVSIKSKKVILDIGYEKFANAIQCYKDEIAKNNTDEKYIKHGSTFFNSGYVDYLDKYSPVDEKTELERLKETDPVEYEKRRPAF